MAREARKVLADMRAMERQAERMNIVDPREVSTEELLGRGATPSMGLSQIRGGAMNALRGMFREHMRKIRGGVDCALDAEDCADANGTYFEGECYGAPASACAGRPSKPGSKCAYPEWAPRQAGTATRYRPGDRVMYEGRAYEATSVTTNQPIRQPPDPQAYTISPYWKAVECDKWGSGAAEESESDEELEGGVDCALDEEECADTNGTYFEGQCYGATASACEGKPPTPGTCKYPEWKPRQAGTADYYRKGDKVMYKGLPYEAITTTSNPPLRQPPDPNAGKLEAQWKVIVCGKGGSRMVGGLASRSGNPSKSGQYRGLGAGSPSAMAMADVNSLKGGKKELTWFDKFVDGLIEKATKKVGELAEKAFNEYFDKLIEYGWNYAKEHGVNWIRENVFGDRVAKGVENNLKEEEREVERARQHHNSEADEYRRRRHEDDHSPAAPAAPAAKAPVKNSAATRKAAASAERDRIAAAKAAYERSRKSGGSDLEGGYGNYGAYAGGHCPSEEHLQEDVSGKGGKGGKKSKARRAPASANDGRRSRAAIVKKVMAEHGLKMIDASKYVKAHGLY